MPCRFASSGTVATSRSASRAILALNAASNFLRDLVISVLHRLRQSRTLHTLTFGPISGVHFKLNAFNERIAELENEGHSGHAMEVLKANAIDFARQIDELRCVLVESTKKAAPNGRL